MSKNSSNFLFIQLSALRVLMREDGATGGAESGSPSYC